MYTIYTREFDEEIHASVLVENWREGRTENVVEATKNWNKEQSGGLVLELTPSTVPLRLIIDCSGSLRGHNARALACALYIIGQSLSKINRPFELLGFTTKNWRGGESRKKWLENGRLPHSPGRLNDLRHVVFKSLEEPWEKAWDNLFLFHVEGFLKENIDGEALEWTHSREETPGHIVFVSDGAPIDDSTLSLMPAQYLNNHLSVVMDTILDSGTKLSSSVILPERNRLNQRESWPNPTFIKPQGDEKEYAEGIQKSIECLFHL